MISTRLKFFSALLFVLTVVLGGLLFKRRGPPPSDSLSQVSPEKSSVVIAVSRSQAQTNDPPNSKLETQNQPSLSIEDQKKKAIFEEILQTKKDNDPRIDQELNHLSPELKKVLMMSYLNLALEQRNQRGFAALLLAREASGEQEYLFLKDILEEKTCLSLQNCDSPSTDKDDPHHSGTDEVTLSYPQLVVLYQIEQRLGREPALLENPKERGLILKVIEAGLRSDSELVKRRALALIEKYKI